MYKILFFFLGGCMAHAAQASEHSFKESSYLWDEETKTLTHQEEQEPFLRALYRTFSYDGFKPQKAPVFFNCEQKELLPAATVRVARGHVPEGGESLILYTRNDIGDDEGIDTFHQKEAILKYGVYQNDQALSLFSNLTFVELAVSFCPHLNQSNRIDATELWRVLEPNVFYKKIEFRPNGGKETVVLCHVFTSQKGRLDACKIAKGTLDLGKDGVFGDDFLRQNS